MAYAQVDFGCNLNDFNFITHVDLSHLSKYLVDVVRVSIFNCLFQSLFEVIQLQVKWNLFHVVLLLVDQKRAQLLKCV